MHEGCGWYTHRLQDALDLDEDLWLLRLGHALTVIFRRGGQVSMAEEELAVLELDRALIEALEQASARWRARVA